MTVRVEDLRLDANLHSAKTGAGFGLALTRGCAAVDKNVCVVHVALVAGMNFDCLHPTGLLDRKAEDEIPIGIRSFRGKDQGLLCRENQVGCSEAPILGKLWLRRQIG